MVFADTFEIKYKLKLILNLKKGSAVRHFFGKNFLAFKKQKRTSPTHQLFKQERLQILIY